MSLEKAPLITEVKEAPKIYASWLDHPQLAGGVVKYLDLIHKFLAFGYENLTKETEDDVKVDKERKLSMLTRQKERDAVERQREILRAEKEFNQLKDLSDLVTIYVVWCLELPNNVPPVTEVFTLRRDSTLMDLKRKLEQTSTFYSKQTSLALKQSGDQKSFHQVYWMNKRIVRKQRMEAAIMDDSYLDLLERRAGEFELVILGENVKLTKSSQLEVPPEEPRRKIRAPPMPVSFAPLSGSQYTMPFSDAQRYSGVGGDGGNGGGGGGMTSGTDSPTGQDQTPPPPMSVGSF